MAGITGLPTSKKLQDTDQDLRENQTQSFVTVQPIGSNRHALDVNTMGVYFIQESGSVAASSTDNILKFTSHNAKVGDIVRIEVSANSINEYEVSVKEVVDANTLKLNCILSASLSTGDTVSILRSVAQRMDSSGATLSSVTVPPIQFDKDGSIVTVHKDTGTPANSIPLPVELVSFSGDINLTAGDLNVQSTHAGGNYDSIRIGDGTDLLEINATGEALVHDEDLKGLLTTIDADTGSIDSKIPANLTVTSTRLLVDGSGVTQPVSGPLTDAQLRASAVPVSAASLPLPTGAASEATLSALEAKFPSALGQQSEAASLSVTLSTENEQDLAAIKTSVQLIDDAIVASKMVISADQLPAALGATTKAASISVALATDTGTLPTSNTQLPAALGQTNKAGSLSVTLANDQGTLIVSEGPPAAVTVKSAQVTVGTSAVRITTDGSAVSTTRQMLSFRPITTGSARFFWGASGVTTSTGAEVYPGESVILENNINDYYIISDTAAQKFHVVEAE